MYYALNNMITPVFTTPKQKPHTHISGATARTTKLESGAGRCHGLFAKLMAYAWGQDLHPT